MADAEEQKKKRTFRKYSYRGIDLDKLLDMSNQDVPFANADRFLNSLSSLVCCISFLIWLCELLARPKYVAGWGWACWRGLR